MSAAVNHYGILPVAVRVELLVGEEVVLGAVEHILELESLLLGLIREDVSYA